jgi:hypothetical protein
MAIGNEISIFVLPARTAACSDNTTAGDVVDMDQPIGLPSAQYFLVA